MSDAYGFLSPIYQPLSRLFFGRDLLEANTAFTHLASGKRTLIIGGGDGVAYRDWDGTYQGEYWDLSEKMAARARKNMKGSRVMVNCERWAGGSDFDVVLLPFVLDTLRDAEIQDLISQIKSALRPGGMVIVSDFFPSKKLTHRSLQWLMITGFQILASHQRSDLPTISEFFDPNQWELVEERRWKEGWVRARVYRLI